MSILQSVRKQEISGIGGKMLEELARQKAGKDVLEVELPEDSEKKKNRIL